MKVGRFAVLLFAALGLIGCTETRETIPDRSAVEQLLISTAVDHVVARIDVSVPAGTKVFVDAKLPDGFDGTYAASAVRDKFARGGAALVGNRAEAEAIAEVRTGALSVDKSDSLFGIPQYDLPLPFTQGLAFPEMALWKRELRQGVVKFGVTTYDARTGRLRASVAPIYGFSYRAHYVALLFFSWTSDDLISKKERPRRGPLW